MVKLTDHDSLSRETVRRRLAENHLKPWQRDMWCIPKVDAEYVARMEDVLDLYAEQPDPKRPVVCFDESPTQLIGEARQPIPAAPGRPQRFDYEYRRNGAVDDNEVAFVYKDYRRGGRSRIMRLAPHEFIRRFLLHVLPDGLHRIRHYGFLAKGDRGRKKLAPPWRRPAPRRVQAARSRSIPGEGAVQATQEADRRSRAPSCAAQIAGLHAPH